MNFRSFTKPEVRPARACSPAGSVSLFTPPPPEYCHNTALVASNLASTATRVKDGIYAFERASWDWYMLDTQCIYASGKLLFEGETNYVGSGTSTATSFIPIDALLYNSTLYWSVSTVKTRQESIRCN